MFNFKTSIIIFHLFCYIHGSDVCTTVGPTPAQESHVIDTIQELGRKISYAQWDKSPPPSNVVLSSLSIAIILNLLMASTNGTTKTEIKEALSYANDLEECVIHQVFQKLISSLEGASENQFEISLNTKLFPQKGFSILNSFRNISTTYYFSDIQYLDYDNLPDVANQIINKWVSDITNGKIPNLFSEPQNYGKLLIIVNVIFFNATWENKFSPADTENGTFAAESGNITIPMMNNEITVPYLYDSVQGFQIILLPYVGNRFSMCILKPTGDNSVIRLKEIENKINSSELNNIIGRMEPTLVKVKIPRMKLNFELSLNDDLQNMGINQIFEDGADFGRMVEGYNLGVGKIVHKAILEVAENGTGAAAVTDIIIERIFTLRSVPPEFLLNKPSLLYIWDNENNATLLSAKVTNPEPIWLKFCW